MFAEQDLLTNESTTRYSQDNKSDKLSILLAQAHEASKNDDFYKQLSKPAKTVLTKEIVAKVNRAKNEAINKVLLQEGLQDSFRPSIGGVPLVNKSQQIGSSKFKEYLLCELLAPDGLDMPMNQLTARAIAKRPTLKISNSCWNKKIVKYERAKLTLLVHDRYRGENYVDITRLKTLSHIRKILIDKRNSLLVDREAKTHIKFSATHVQVGKVTYPIVVNRVKSKGKEYKVIKVGASHINVDTLKALFL